MSFCFNKKGKIHSENDYPAFQMEDGSKCWYKEGQEHRDNDKPAILKQDGDKEWRINGILHRENGPAIEYFWGTSDWWINDANYSKIGYFYFLIHDSNYNINI